MQTASAPPESTNVSRDAAEQLGVVLSPSAKLSDTLTNSIIPRPERAVVKRLVNEKVRMSYRVYEIRDGDSCSRRP
jgi:hypothetical protein